MHSIFLIVGITVSILWLATLCEALESDLNVKLTEFQFHGIVNELSNLIPKLSIELPTLEYLRLADYFKTVLIANNVYGLVLWPFPSLPFQAENSVSIPKNTMLVGSFAFSADGFFLHIAREWPGSDAIEIGCNYPKSCIPLS